MQTVDFDKLYEMALGVAKPRTLTPHTEVGAVGAALLTDSGAIYLGANIDTACSMGFCAEHAAAAAMLTAGENEISRHGDSGGKPHRGRDRGQSQRRGRAALRPLPSVFGAAGAGKLQSSGDGGKRQSDDTGRTAPL